MVEESQSVREIVHMAEEEEISPKKHFTMAGIRTHHLCPLSRVFNPLDHGILPISLTNSYITLLCTNGHVSSYRKAPLNYKCFEMELSLAIYRKLIIPLVVKSPINPRISDNYC